MPRKMITAREAEDIRKEVATDMREIETTRALPTTLPCPFCETRMLATEMEEHYKGCSKNPKNLAPTPVAPAPPAPLPAPAPTPPPTQWVSEWQHPPAPAPASWTAPPIAPSATITPFPGRPSPGIPAGYQRNGIPAPKQRDASPFLTMQKLAGRTLQATILDVDEPRRGQYGTGIDISVEVPGEGRYKVTIKLDSQNHADLYTKYGQNWTGKHIEIRPTWTAKGSARMAVVPL